MGEEPQLQRRLVESMLLAGELSLAQQHQELFGLSGEFEIRPERLAAEQARRRDQYLQMPLAPQAVHFVDCLAGLAAMGQRLEALLLAQPARHGAAHNGPAATDEQWQQQQQPQEAGASGSSSSGGGDRDAELLPAVGIDLEWQPDSENSSPPSILQISTGEELWCGGRLAPGLGPGCCPDRNEPGSIRCIMQPTRPTLSRVLPALPASGFADSEVFVIDLLALTGRDAELAAALSPVLTSDRVFKLGCGIASDCKRLAGRHPRAFSLARACLDLSTLWRSHFIEQSEQWGLAGGLLPLQGAWLVCSAAAQQPLSGVVEADGHATPPCCACSGQAVHCGLQEACWRDQPERTVAAGGGQAARQELPGQRLGAPPAVPAAAGLCRAGCPRGGNHLPRHGPAAPPLPHAAGAAAPRIHL